MPDDKRTAERHICEYTYDCQLSKNDFQGFETPSPESGVSAFKAVGILLLAGFEQVIENLDLIGLDESAMEALRLAHETIESETFC